MGTFEGSREVSHTDKMGLFSAYTDSAGNPDTSRFLYKGFGVGKQQVAVLLWAVILLAWLGWLWSS